LWYRNCFRVYIEGIDAVSCNEDQLGILTDENRSDLLNAFVELRPWVCGDEFLGVRLGRQELLFGEQRLISPLDWANTRRTFDSVTRVLYRSHDWDLDGFWGKPLPPDRHNFDQADQSRQFGGFYGTYKGVPKNTFDVYALSLLECDDNIFPRQGVRGDMEIYTVGGRWKADCNDWLWEFEGAYQFGEQGSLPHEAGMATAGCGRRFANCWAKPEIWFYYDWASGDNDPTDNHISTFNQQFPLGHRYFGFMDLVARSNIRDPNVMMLFYPCDKVKLTVWYHRFMLDEGRDALYNAAGLRIRSDPTGFSGTDVGDEIDLMLDIEIRRHCSWQFGYCHFCPGGFIKTTTATPSARGDAELLYAQFAFRF
jgi:hypothetical protein